MKDVCPEYLNEIFITKDFVRNTRGSSDIFILKNCDASGSKFGRNSTADKMVNNWNELPACLRHLENFNRFLKDLKTHYFNEWLCAKDLVSS